MELNKEDSIFIGSICEILIERFKFSKEILDFYKDYSFSNLKKIYSNLDKSKDEKKYFLMSAILVVYCNKKYKYQSDCKQKEKYFYYNSENLCELMSCKIRGIDRNSNSDMCLIN